MKSNDVITVYVAYTSTKGGKRRPFLVLETDTTNVKGFALTTQYENKTEAIKKQYYPLKKWQAIGLSKPTYVDVGNVYSIPKEKASFKKVGILHLSDIQGLSKFINNNCLT